MQFVNRVSFADLLAVILVSTIVLVTAKLLPPAIDAVIDHQCAISMQSRGVDTGTELHQ